MTTAAAASPSAGGDASSRFYKHGLVSLDPNSKHAAPNLLARLSTPVPYPLVGGESRFIRTASLLFELDGRPRRWDCAQGICRSRRSDCWPWCIQPANESQGRLIQPFCCYAAALDH